MNRMGLQGDANGKVSVNYLVCHAGKRQVPMACPNEETTARANATDRDRRKTGAGSTR
jgi:hypothetical protein